MEPERDAPTETRQCIYCGRDKPVNEFSLEHIFPDRLGGTLRDDFFKTKDVCRKCNSTMGMFVDAPFIKNFFRANDEALATQEYLDLNSPASIQPLMYMGFLEEVDLGDDLVCEMWLGPCGSHLYHVHKRDEPAFASYAGGNPIARQGDPGRVYLLVTTDHPLWIFLALRSMKAAFRRATRYAGNLSLTPEQNASGFIVDMDDAATAELAKIRSLPDKKAFTVPTVPGFELRFLAKLAIGLGYKLFGATFLTTPYAKHLRDMLWEQDPAVHARIPVRGSGFFAERDDPTEKILGWPGAYTIRLQGVGKHFALTIHLPSGKAMHIAISDDPTLWSGARFDQYQAGVVYLILPALGMFVGPIAIPRYIGHRNKTSSNASLAAIEAKRVDPKTLPPCVSTSREATEPTS